jgi:hypothetical protein
MKIEFGKAASPALAGTFRSREEERSSLKVEAKLLKEGGMSVSPSVSTVFWYFVSTMMYFNCLREKVSLGSDSTKGTVGIPSHLVAVFR